MTHWQLTDADRDMIERDVQPFLPDYGYRREPYGIRASFSYDQGRTWDIAHEVVLRTDGGGRDLGYPSSVELPDGSILSAYYFHTESDTTRRIEATKWQPN